MKIMIAAGRLMTLCEHCLQSSGAHDQGRSGRCLSVALREAMDGRAIECEASR